MRYSIFYLLSGEAKKYNEKLMRESADVSGERYVVDVSKLPPHITLRSPFEFDDFKKLDSLLKDFAKKQKKTKIRFKSFGNFRRFVSFMKPSFSVGTKIIQKELIKELDKKLRIRPHEFDVKHHPHATICYGNNKEQFNLIWNYLKKQKKPNFELEFNEIALMEKVDNQWAVKKKYELK
jgi:2'-5' RNA ligase